MLQPTNIPKDPLGSAWIIVAAFFFTLMGVLVKQAGTQFNMTHYELVFWRVLLAVIVLAAQARWRGHSLKTPYLKEHFERGITGSISLLLFFYGLTHLPLATAITLNYTSALFLALFSIILLHEKPSAKMWFGLLFGLAGIVVLLQPAFSSGMAMQTVIALGSGVFAGYAYLQVRELSQAGEPAWRVVFYFSLMSGVIAAVFATFHGWHLPTLSSIPILLGIGITAMFAQLAMTRAYHVGRKFTVASLSYLAVVFSALYAWLFAGEPLGWLEILGMVMIIVAGVVSSLK
ncbi:DMT family transporter [Wielerella bovis]|uniref:DMT family transporter n=1 Tax=Wielerella bovis TaxID=2917790 RepID=UPI002019F1EC|nr:DMT family transporter [Wielerella bovis]ULJ63232.1 DMT family transporter [Wielerella bovis]